MGGGDPGNQGVFRIRTSATLEDTALDVAVLTNVTESSMIRSELIIVSMLPPMGRAIQAVGDPRVDVFDWAYGRCNRLLLAASGRQCWL